MSFPKKERFLKRTTNEQYYKQEELVSSLSKQSIVLDAFQIKFNR